jgi:hypothetical protein
MCASGGANATNGISPAIPRINAGKGTALKSKNICFTTPHFFDFGVSEEFPTPVGGGGGDADGVTLATFVSVKAFKSNGVSDGVGVEVWVECP